MPKLIDLTGQKFGELTVLGRDLEYPKINNIKKKSETYWKVQCSCGNIISVMGWQLQKQKSCGKCVEREALGLRFGKLTIKECLGQYKIGNQKYATQTRFRCLCDCGNYIDVSWSHLQTGHNCSFGCSNRY